MKALGSGTVRVVVCGRRHQSPKNSSWQIGQPADIIDQVNRAIKRVGLRSDSVERRWRTHEPELSACKGFEDELIERTPEFLGIPECRHCETVSVRAVKRGR